MTRPLVWSRDPGGSHEYPWGSPFPRAARHLRLGLWDVRVLDQDGVWVDSAAAVHRIRDLSDEHLVNIITMMRVKAVDMMRDYTMAAGLARFTPKAPMPARTGTVRESAQDWIRTTRLWDALQVEVSARARRRPGTTQRLDSGTGTWVVRTRNSSYVLDLDRARVLRLPDSGAGQLRRDEEWAVLHAHGPIRVRYPVLLNLKVSDDPDVAVTIRVTSPVVAIHQLTAPAGASGADLVDLARAVTRAARPDRPIPEPPTQYRTSAFRVAAFDIRVFWAALTVLLDRHHASEVLIVPSRLRHPDADPGDADLLIEQISDSELHALQREVQGAMGYHLPVTTIADYPGRSRADIGAHAIAFAPGW